LIASGADDYNPTTTDKQKKTKKICKFVI